MVRLELVWDHSAVGGSFALAIERFTTFHSYPEKLGWLHSKSVSMGSKKKLYLNKMLSNQNDRALRHLKSATEYKSFICRPSKHLGRSKRVSHKVSI